MGYSQPDGVATSEGFAPGCDPSLCKYGENPEYTGGTRVQEMEAALALHLLSI
jgi:hypothetical protein